MQVSALELFFQPTQVNVLRYQRKKTGDNFPPGLYCVDSGTVPGSGDTVEKKPDPVSDP